MKKVKETSLNRKKYDRCVDIKISFRCNLLQIILIINKEVEHGSGRTEGAGI
ncbi:hypothetical protein [Desulfurobacterium sp.]|uniref:hypothetical protein n=1 Tax=Desulfurobacterium sp. TaxID=2004706 RepID=UPI002632DE0B|nr:hypothetical protein [Desulfurobacterium sp.]